MFIKLAREMRMMPTCPGFKWDLVQERGGFGDGGQVGRRREDGGRRQSRRRLA